VLAQPVSEAHIDAAPTIAVRDLLISIAAAQETLTKLRDSHALTCHDVIGLYHEGQVAERFASGILLDRGMMPMFAAV
jgi:hypothetical protein